MTRPFRRAYAALDAYTAPARARAEFWRVVAGVALIVATYLASLLLLSIYLTETYGSFVAAALLQRVAHGETPGAMLLLLWSFLGLVIGAFAAVRLIHGRPAGTLFGPSARQALRDFARVAVPVTGFHLILLPISLSAEEIRPGLTFAVFLGYLPFALPSLLIQTGAEEIVFRGYLQQQLAARFRHPVIWMGAPAAFFAWGHYVPADFGANAWAVALWAGVFALLAADLTARTGSLGAALGLHYANNLSALCLTGLENNLDGLALWTLSIDLSDPSVIVPSLSIDFAIMLITWLIARIALRV